MVSPLNSDCQSRYSYTKNGEIISFNENDKDAQRTIDLLGLNCKKLKDKRLSIIKTLEDAESDFIQESLLNCVDWYSGFYSVIEYMKN